MSLFAKSKRDNDPVDQAEWALAEVRAAHAKLADRLSAAEAVVAEKRAVGERLALGAASDIELDKAEGETRAAEDRVKTLSAALAQLDAQIAENERALAETREHRDREMVAAGLEALAAAIATTYPTFNDAGAELVRAVTNSQAQIPETARLVNFLQGTRHEVAAACNMLDQELRSRAVRIRAGTCKFTIDRSAEEQPKIASAVSPT